MLGTAGGTGLCKAFSSLIPKKLGEGPATTGDPGGEESEGQGGRGHVGWDPGAPLPPRVTQRGTDEAEKRGAVRLGAGSTLQDDLPRAPLGASDHHGPARSRPR